MAGKDVEPRSDENNEKGLLPPEDDPSFSDYDLLVLDSDPTWQKMKLAVEHVELLEEDGRNR